MRAGAGGPCVGAPAMVHSYEPAVWLDLAAALTFLALSTVMARVGRWSAAALYVLLAIWLARAGVSNYGRAGHDVSSWVWLYSPSSNAASAVTLLVCGIAAALEARASSARTRRLERRIYGEDAG